MAAVQTTVDPAEALLRRLWTQDGQSFKQIAEALTTLTGRTVTRSAVSGRIHRLGLTGMQAPPADATPPPPAAGQAGAESVLAMPISEPDQQVEAVPEARVEPRKAPRIMHAGMRAKPSIVAAKISVPAQAEPVSDSATSEEVAKTDMAAAPAPTYAPGTWPMAATLPAQCKFACTPHSARPEQHRFCGEPVAWKNGKPTSWCRDHLDVVSGAPGRTPGGASVADITNGQARPDREPARTGWGATGA